MPGSARQISTFAALVLWAAAALAAPATEPASTAFERFKALADTPHRTERTRR